MLRTLALLRSLRGAHQSLQDTRSTIQQACDYRWLHGELARGTVTATDAALSDGTPAVAVTLTFLATAERRRGGNWPSDPEARERCHVPGVGACRAAGAPAYRSLESLSRGLAQGALNVLRDAARFDYLLERDALWLTWRRAGHLPASLARRLPAPPDEGPEDAEHPGFFLLEVRVPGSGDDAAPSGTWLDRRLDRYRRILPASP